MTTRITLLAWMVSLALGGGQASAADLREITIPIASTAFAASGLRVAKELGLFEKNGLAAKIVVMDSGNAALTALISGAAQAAEAASGELVAAQARGQPVVAIADLYRGYSGSLVLAKSVAGRTGIAADAPVAQRLKVLDGLLIATPSATSIYTLAFREAAEAAGAKIRFTYMNQPAMAAALDTNAIQGMIAGAPFWSPAVARGAGVLWISGPSGELPLADTPLSSATLLTLESTTRTDGALIKQLRQVVVDLGTAITEHPDQVEAAVARLYPTLDQNTLRLLLATEMQNLKTRPLTTADMRHEVDYVRSSGMPIPNLDTLDPARLLPGY